MLPPDEPVKPTKRDEAMIRDLQETFEEYADLAPKMHSDVLARVLESEDMAFLCDYVAQHTSLKYTDKQEVLEQKSPRRRIGLLIKKLAAEVEILRIEARDPEQSAGSDGPKPAGLLPAGADRSDPGRAGGGGRRQCGSPANMQSAYWS